MTSSTLAPVPTVATTMASSSAPSIYDCNFEQNLCNWSQSISDEFDWTRNKGRTSSSDTGPITDHTTGTDAGFYIYIEVSAPRKPNQKAQIVSANIVTTTTKCLRFWYHMYGLNIKTLNVYLKSSATPGKLFWTHKGSLSNKWYQAQVDIQGNSTYKIMFEAVVGHGVRGDIAVDDITVREGSCAGL
ncbi:MAM and LDL-receptor class A domain-containing protein 1,MAM and LDL-receptor class A domain-containing protein 2 [Mytilus coruscus]|uniref:MAM and LDL-receptor class A domain-containing protein 1,MAM and LDL-receptor class A domain-containing protein 2 n=1 Tax=Mytilus coruscus TaxID=42192 RepID=A0A6J8B5R9_MYTCO|nr:MAM and LDL-receptor class A domain-containing protein 1,MAM and LDL-receptor class A domain-containing protein 2 [Mytilus coruscus]